MKILVTGKNGQLARCLKDKTADFPNLSLTFAARSDADVILDMGNQASIRKAVRSVKPDIIINAAAYTEVDNAEDNTDLAMLINGKAPGILAAEAKDIGAILLQISTDHVFDGTSDRPYEPEDNPNPVNGYGRSKLAGEHAVRDVNGRYAILRTAWVHSPYGKNFATKMLKRAEANAEITVVADQIGNPTAAHDLAHWLLQLCQSLQAGDDRVLGKIHHFVGSKVMTRFEFVRNLIAEHGLDCTVLPCKTANFKTKAQRPLNAVMKPSSLIGS